MVPLIHDIAVLDSIYIICDNEAPQKEWTKEWSKIEGVFTTINSICESMKKVARQCDHDTIPMSFVSKRTMAAASGEKNLDQLEPSFMYSQLFKEIVLEIDEDDTKPLNDLIIYARNKNIPEHELKRLKRRYYQRTPVWWYTYEFFLYGMLNRALRSLDMGTMIKMGFFIRSLHRQLEQLHHEQFGTSNKIFTVYRGQSLSGEDFQHLVDTKGGLLAFNNFLSTSKEQGVAIKFVKCALNKNKDIVGVLFKMKVDSSKVSASTTPFALIDDYSAISQEKEVLFSMHTVFRVGDIKQTTENNGRLWEVQLTLTDDNDSQLVNLTKHMQEELCGSIGWHRMSKLMLKVGHSDQAEQLYNELLENASSDSERGYIYHQLAEVKMNQGLYRQSGLLYEECLKIYRTTIPEDHPSFADLYNNIGEVYNNTRDYSKALEYFEKSHQIKEKTLPPNDSSLAISYNNFGSVYDYMHDYSKALEYFEKARKINEEVLPSNHPNLGISYGAIGGVYKNLGNYSKALEYYEKTLEIHKKTLPPNHPHLVTSYNNIGLTYNNMENYPKALEYFEKVHQINETQLAPNHPHFATSYNNVGLAYRNMGNYSKALEYFEKAHKIKEQIWPSNHPEFALSCNNIAAVYEDMGDYSKAIEYFEKAYQIFENVLPPNHPDLAISYWNIGSVYKITGDYTRALSYLEKALGIFQKSLPPTHTHVKSVINTIEYVRKKL
ncbi:unnamed protein product [Rotaria sp. Silwood2]|nr:unnamed protein product [Rotaria sp. Silwood2]